MSIITNAQARKNDTIIFDDGTQFTVTRIDRTADIYGDHGVYGSNEDGSEHGPYFPGDYAILSAQTAQQGATVSVIQDIAAVFIESATAAENFMHTGNADELTRHEELFTTATADFQALIAADSALHDCELRGIHYAIAQGNFTDARARYAALAQ